MKRHLLIAAAAALLFAPSAMATEDDSAAAAGADQETLQVEPGSAPTDAMTEETPKMVEESDHEAHPPTAEIGDEVPPMTPDDEKQAADDSDSPDDAQ